MKRTFFAFAALALLLTLSSFFRPLAPVGAEPGGYAVGDTAADFKLKNVDGKLLALADDKAAKGFIVVFTCNHCPFAQAYEQRIIALHQKFAPQGYPVVAIQPNDPVVEPADSFGEMKKRAKEMHYAFPYLLDDTQAVAHAFGATKTPHVFVLTRAGAALKVAYIGAIDNNTEDANAATEKYVEKALAEIMAGKPVGTATTKAVGCGIKWKKS